MHAPHNATVVHMLRLLVLLSFVSVFFNGIPSCTNEIPPFEEVPFTARSDGLLPESTGFRRTENNETTIELDLGSCGHQSKVPCIESGACESIPLLEPARCRRRYCPLNKVYCLDFDGCMIPDPIFIFSLSTKEKKCLIPLSLCANKDLCQYVLRKNYDDLREPSVDRLNCSLMTNQIVFTNSSCKAHSDCHWTAKCCPDGGLNRQCVTFERKILPARVSNDVDSATTDTSPSSTPFNSDDPFFIPVDPWPTSSQNKTKSTMIRIMNPFNTVVEGKLLEFQLSMRVQLAKLLNISETVFTRMIARNGSIVLEVEMSPVTANMTVEVDQAYVKLTSMLKQGSLVLTDLNSTKLNIPPQQNGVLTEETGGYSNIFIGVTAASLSSTFLLIFWVVWNLKKNKTINPMGSHSERLNSDSLFMIKPSTDNHLGLGSGRGIGRNSNNKFTTFAESQVQWEIFQQHFPAKPDYVWKSQSDEAVWAGIDHQVQWPQLLDTPDEESVPITNRPTKQ